MQLQTQVPHRDWSSAAATSILQAQLVPLMKEKKKNPKDMQAESANICWE